MMRRASSSSACSLRISSAKRRDRFGEGAGRFFPEKPSPGDSLGHPDGEKFGPALGEAHVERC